MVCLRVFCKLGDPVDVDVCGTNDEITAFINAISPPNFQCPIATEVARGGKNIKHKRASSIKKRGKPRRSKRLSLKK